MTQQTPRGAGRAVAFLSALIATAAGCGSDSVPLPPEAVSGAGAGADAGGVSGAKSEGGGGQGGAAGAKTGGTTANGGAQTSGAGGSGIMVPPVKVPPVNCDGLSDKKGVWENISPPPLLLPDVETVTVAASPLDGTVFATGSNKTGCPTCPVTSSGVIRSSDCGATFERAHDVEEGTDNANLITGAIWAMVMNNATPQIMYVANGYGSNPTIYRTIDAGTTWKSLDAGVNFVQAIGIDRRNESHIAVTFHNNCEPPRKPWCFSTSNDGGDTWTMFDGPTGDGIGGWVEAASITVLGATSYLVGSIAGVWYTGDTGATWKKVANDTLYLPYSGATTIADGNLIHAGAGAVLFSKAAPGLEPPFELAMGSSLEKIPNSPTISTLLTAGDLVFGGNQQPDKQPFHTAPTKDIMTWTKMPQEICDAAGKTCRGPAEMAYDPIHRVVYAANYGAGLWRYVLP